MTSLLRSANHVDVSDVSDVLRTHQRHHALATLCHAHGRTEEALEMWKDICEETLIDCTFPGFEYIVDVISRCFPPSWIL